MMRQWTHTLAAIGGAVLFSVGPAIGQSAATLALSRGHAVILDAMAKGDGRSILEPLSQSRHYAELLDDEMLVGLLALNVDKASRARNTLIVGPVLGKRVSNGGRGVVSLLLEGQIPSTALTPVILIIGKSAASLDAAERNQVFEVSMSLMLDDGAGDELRFASMTVSRLMLDHATPGDTNFEHHQRDRDALLQDIARNAAAFPELRSMAVREMSLSPTSTTVGVLRDIMSPEFPPRCRAAACMGLAVLNETTAIPSLADIVRTSEDPLLAGTAAMAIAQLDTEEGLQLLVQSDRWAADNGVRLAIEQSAPRVLSMLKDPAGSGWVGAVRATETLYRHADCKRALTELLPRLSEPLSAETREAICDLVARRGTIAQCELALQSAGHRSAYTTAEESILVRLETMRRFGEPASQE